MEVFYDGIEIGKVDSQEYHDLVDRYTEYIKSMFHDGILIISSITLNNRDANKITHKSINDIFLPSSDIVESSFLNKSDDILKLALAERAHIVLISRINKMVIFIDGFHCQTFILDKSLVDDIKNKLECYGLFLWKQ